MAAYKLEPSNLDIVYNIGVVLIEQKKYEAAVAIFTEILSINPNHVLALKERAKLYFKLDKKQEFELDCQTLEELAIS